MSTKKEIKIFVPATVANVGCGFDVLGFAVDQPGENLTARFSKERGVKITKITGAELPFDPEKNVASLPVIKMLKQLNINEGVELEIEKFTPLGSGLGSSASSAVAGVFAVNKLLGEPLTLEELLPLAMEGEYLASASYHADNLAPALYGGFTIVRSYNPLEVVRIGVPKNLFVSVVHPDIFISTAAARKILPENIPLKKAITQWGNVAGLIAGLMQEDYALIGRSLEDVIVEPVRSPLIPHFAEVKEAALKNDALGAGIAGSGPSIFAFSNSLEKAKKIGQAMSAVYNNNKIGNQVYISKINQHGPKIL